MKKPLLWICIIAVIIVAAIIISVVAKNNARWVKINDIKGYADFSDTQIEKITLRKSVTSPEWAVFRDDDLLSQWEAFFKKLELKRGSRPAEADLSLNGGGLRIVIVSTNGKEYSFGIYTEEWQPKVESFFAEMADKDNLCLSIAIDREILLDKGEMGKYDHIWLSQTEHSSYSNISGRPRTKRTRSPLRISPPN